MAAAVPASHTGFHPLTDKWVLWAHLPHDTNWTLASYIKIMKIETMEEMIAVVENLPEALISNCMLFMMKEGINPMWEDKKNRDGGCFSFKSNNKSVVNAWKNLSYAVAGNCVTKDDDIYKNITGITISSKKSFCIIKIWMSGCSYQNPAKIEKLNGLNFQGVLFKRHANNAMGVKC